MFGSLVEDEAMHSPHYQQLSLLCFFSQFSFFFFSPVGSPELWEGCLPQPLFQELTKVLTIGPPPQ